MLLIGKQKGNYKAGVYPHTNCNKSKRHQLVWGFTFIELILTSLIILVIVGLSAPIFRKTFHDLRVNLQTKDLASLMNLAREKSIMTRISHSIIVYEDENVYRMAMYDIDAKKLKAVSGKWGKRFTLSNDINLKSSKDEIKFFADGSSNGAVLSLIDSDGLKTQIKIDAGTGEIIVIDAKEE